MVLTINSVDLQLRYDSDNVPFLSYKNIEAISLIILEQYNEDLLNVPQAIDIDHFAEFFLDCEIDSCMLSHNQCYLGMSIFRDGEQVPVYDEKNKSIRYIYPKSNTIILDSSLSSQGSDNRRRFTLAHECGHMILHKKYFAEKINQELVGYVYHQDPMITYPIKTPHQWMEWQANSLGAALLMNAVAVIKLLEEHDFILTDLKGGLQMVYASQLMEETFKVSYESASIRLNNLIELFSKL